METLSDQAIDAGVAALPEWTLAADRTTITRDLRFADFSTAFAFMTAVALDAQAADHHPDWSNSWATVKIILTTYAAGGLTQLDLDLAARIDHHAAALLSAGAAGDDACR
jgi:4a-hydroxytetrahydrobiopterin dehydratase